MSESTILALFSLGYAIIALIGLRFFLNRRRLRSNRRFLHSIEMSTTSRAGRDAKVISMSPWILRIIDSSYGSWLRQNLSRAGVWDQTDYERWVSQKVGFGIAGTITALFLFQTSEISLGYLVLIPCVAFFALDLLIMKKAQDRIAAIARSLPETIDLLGMCVMAGIGFHSGMQRIATTSENPLSQEFSRVLGEMKLGRSRSQALLDMSDRLRIPTLTEFVNSVLQVDRLGVPMAKTLDEQSRRMRMMRHERSREQAQKLPVKILAPIMLFLMPALLIIVLGPAVVSILRSFG